MKGWKYESYRHSLAARGIRTSFSEMRFNLPDGWSQEEEKYVKDKIDDLIKRTSEKIQREREIRTFPEVRIKGLVLKNVKEYRPGVFMGWVFIEGKENPWDYNRSYSTTYTTTFDEFVKNFKMQAEQENSDFMERFRKGEAEYDVWRAKNP